MSKFKVGDRVRLVGPQWYCDEDRGHEYNEAPEGRGSLGVVVSTGIPGRRHLGVEWESNGRRSYLATSSFELVTASDNINHPQHYKQLPIEAIEITEHFNFCMGNALKYIIRADHKGNPIEDLEKSIWYLRREVARRRKREDLP